ncbi:hypothetical protein INR49_001624 [Caranx melampygus]|nr:hypothetical protein INR49_001624 [Caranx melampygus]
MQKANPSELGCALAYNFPEQSFGMETIVWLGFATLARCRQAAQPGSSVRLTRMRNRQPLTPRQYCQCNRPTAARKSQQGRKKGKPSALPLQPQLKE